MISCSRVDFTVYPGQYLHPLEDLLDAIEYGFGKIVGKIEVISEMSCFTATYSLCLEWDFVLTGVIEYFCTFSYC